MGLENNLMFFWFQEIWFQENLISEKFCFRIFLPWYTPYTLRPAPFAHLRPMSIAYLSTCSPPPAYRPGRARYATVTKLYGG